MSVCVVNLATLDPESNGGLSRVAREICRLLVDFAQEQSAFYPVFAVQTGFVGRFAKWLERAPTIISIDPLHPNRPILRGLNPDLIVHPLFGMEPFDQIEEFQKVRQIAVMPDALALDIPDLIAPRIRAGRHLTYQHLKTAYRVITLSEYARSQLIYHLQLAPESIVAIPLGADALQPETVSLRFAKPKQPYLFYPANTWPHKRHDLLMQVFQEVLRQRPEMHLVLTGGRVSKFGVQLPKLASRYGIPADHIHDLGYVPDSQMPSLYAEAEALLFTSAYEGFGMPVLEAMRLGCPVICAPVTAIPEVAGDAALYVHSDDPHLWAKAVLEELPKQRTLLVERGIQRAAYFTWKHSRESFRQFLIDCAPDVFGQQVIPTVPMVSLKMVLKEVYDGWIPEVTAVVDPEDHSYELDRHLNYMQSLLQQEKLFWIGHVPVIGLLMRGAIRLRNIGRFWHSSNVVARELVHRQSVLAAEVETLIRK